MKEAPQFLVKVTHDAQGHMQQADWYERADHATMSTMADTAPIDEKPTVFEVKGEDVISPSDSRINPPIVASREENSSMDETLGLAQKDSIGLKLARNKGFRVAVAGLAAFAAANIPGFMRSSTDASANTPFASGISQNIGRTDGGGGRVDSRAQVGPIENNVSSEKILTNPKPEASKSTGTNSIVAVVSTPDGKRYSVVGGIDPVTGKVVLRTKGQLSINGVVTGVSASENSGVVVVSNSVGAIEIFKGNERKVITDTNRIPDLSVTPDGSKAFISHADGTFSILDLALNSLSTPLSTQSTGSTEGSSSTQLGVISDTPLLQIGSGNFRNFGTRIDIYGYVQVDYSDSLVKVAQYGAAEKAEFFRTRVASYKDAVTGKDTVFGIKQSTSSNTVDEIYKYTDNVLVGIYPLSNLLTDPAAEISINGIAIDASAKTGYASASHFDNSSNKNPRVFKFNIEDPTKQESMPIQGLPAIGEPTNIFFFQQNGISKVLLEVSFSSGKGYYAFDEATNSWEIAPIFTSDTTIYIPAALTKYTQK